MRRFLVGFLRERYRVVAFADGAQAVEGAHRFQPNLIIMDMMMPSLNGIQACRLIRRDSDICECRIMLLTARGDDETKLSALQSGADDFLTKPFSSEEVLSRAHNLLENVALQRSLRNRNQELEETITRLHQAEAYLVQSEKMNGLGSLAAGLLHEINNPLNYAQAAIHLARENLETGDPTINDMLKDAHEGMTRISDVISSLRTFAYPETANYSQPFIFAEAVQLALRFTAFKCKELAVQCKIPPDLKVCGSVNQMSMLLVNLITNANRAVRANTNSPGDISITAEERSDSARIEVRDTGIGMDEVHMRQAFDPFYTTCEPGQGMGLGLAICHTSIRNHRGRIGINSQLGAGTTVWFELPIPAAIAAMEPVHG
jgi:signal transduction histidine kinase